MIGVAEASAWRMMVSRWRLGVRGGKRIFSWLLVLVLLHFPVVTQSLNVEQHDSTNHSVSVNDTWLAVHGTETARCDDVHKDPSVVTREDRCEFVRAHCVNDSISLRLIVVYYCSGSDMVSAVLVKPSIILGSLFLLLALFKVMGFTADRYFSTILSQISQDMGLPPRLAGVTLLALGNGAPDLSSSIAAIESGNIHLAMGSLVGSVMFVGCVVAGRLVSLSGGIKCRAAQMRDVLVLCFAVCAVMVIVLFGEITFSVVCILLGIYVVYVIIVAIADFTKRAGVEWAGLLSLFSSSSHWKDDSTSFMERVKSSLLPNSEGDVLLQYEHLPADGNGGSNASSELEMMESPRKVGHVAERATWGGSRLQDLHHGHGDNVETEEDDEDQDIDVDPEIGPTSSSSRVARAASEPATSPRKGRLEYDALIHMSTAEYRTRALADMSDAKTFHAIHFDDKFLEHSSQLEDMLETICEDENKQEGNLHEIEDHIEGERRKKVRFAPPDDATTLSEQPANIKTAVFHLWKALSNAADTAILPLKYLLKGTIPMFDAACREKSWFVTACTLSPLWSLLYFTQFTPSWWSVLAALCASNACALISWYCTKTLVAGDIDAPMLWSCGTGFPIGAALIGMYGFAMAAMWIDAVAGEIVGVIHAFGIIGHIKPSILGLTILAWGNSLTDLMANISMAMRSTGGASMAMTACFAGPLFNLLLGLGLGFLFHFSDAGISSTVIEFDAIVFTGCAFAAINCIAIVMLAIANTQRLPSWVGWLMMAWYSLYMIVVIGISVPT